MLDGFYRIGKTIVTPTVTQANTPYTIDLTSSEFKHKGVLFDWVVNDYTNRVSVQFYDHSKSTGLSDPFTLTILETGLFLLPVRVAKVTITAFTEFPAKNSRIAISLLN